MIEREELHRLLDKMLDSGDCIGDYNDAEVGDDGTIRVKQIRLTIQEKKYEIYDNNPRTNKNEQPQEVKN